MIKDYKTIIESGIEEEFAYYNNLKNLINAKCEKFPSIAKIIELMCNAYEANSKEYFMGLVPHTILMQSVNKDTDHYDYIFNKLNYRSHLIEYIAEFISTFFGLEENKDGKYVNFTIVDTIGSDKSRKWFEIYSTITGCYTEGYTNNPDDWLEFMEKFADIKMKEEYKDE